MQTFKATLTEKIRRTPTVTSFRFMPPERVEFSAGQFLQLVFDESQPGNKELNKYLSFSSSPTRTYIECTKRLSASPFSKRLDGLDAGQQVLFKAPMGSCVFSEEYKKIGFLIGGIGITPAVSIIEYIFEKKLDTDVCLLYSNRTEEEIAFKKELDLWSGQRPLIKVHYTVTDCRPQGAACSFGAIDRKLIEQRVCDLRERIVFIFGPPKMVEAMKQLSLELGVPAGQLKTEVFVGY